MESLLCFIVTKEDFTLANTYVLPITYANDCSLDIQRRWLQSTTENAGVLKLIRFNTEEQVIFLKVLWCANISENGTWQLEFEETLKIFLKNAG